MVEPYPSREGGANRYLILEVFEVCYPVCKGIGVEASLPPWYVNYPAYRLSAMVNNGGSAGSNPVSLHTCAHSSEM